MVAFLYAKYKYNSWSGEGYAHLKGPQMHLQRD